jgi:hypothetical protein
MDQANENVARSMPVANIGTLGGTTSAVAGVRATVIAAMASSPPPIDLASCMTTQHARSPSHNPDHVAGQRADQNVPVTAS